MVVSAGRYGRLLVARPAPRTRSGFSARVVMGHVLRFVSVGLLVAIGVIHLHLWFTGYRYLPTNGPLFLADAVAAFVLALALLAWPRVLVAILGIGFAVATLGALIVSINFGLFGFTEFSGGPFVSTSIVIESMVSVCLAAWIVVVPIRLGST